VQARNLLAAAKTTELRPGLTGREQCALLRDLIIVDRPGKAGSPARNCTVCDIDGIDPRLYVLIFLRSSRALLEEDGAAVRDQEMLSSIA